MMSIALTGYETVHESVDGEALRAKMADFMQYPEITNRLAFLGDRIIGLTVAQHLLWWRIDSSSLQKTAELYWTSAALAEVFDEFRLASPRSGDNGWNAHTKAQKVEALVAYLHQKKTSDLQNAELLCRLMNHILDAGDRRRGVVSKV
jgi:dsRNA-specific ribonuclease